jgi:hypothetical protein
MSKKKKQIQVGLDAKALETLEELKAATGETLTGVLRHALGLYNFAYQEHLAGRDIATIREGKLLRQVLLPFTMQQAAPNKDELKALKEEVATLRSMVAEQ